MIETPLLGQRATDFERFSELQPLGRLGQPRDVVHAVRYLASEPFITGVELAIDGGFSVGSP